MLNYTIGNAFLNALFARGDTMKGNALSEDCWIGVSTTKPTQNTTGVITNFTEPAASTGYKRTRLGINGNSATYVMDAAANNEIKNGTNFIFFDEAVEGGGGFGTVTWFGLFSNATGGAPLLAGELTAPVTVAEKHVLLFRPEDLKVTLESTGAEENG